MKRYLRLTSILLAFFIILPLSSCFDPNYDWDLPERDPVILPPIFDLPEVTQAIETAPPVITETPEEGIILRLADDGTHYIAAGCRNKNVESLTIPNKYNDLYVTEIADHAFAGMKKLSYISIPDSVLHVGYKAFEGCTSLVYEEYFDVLYLGSPQNYMRVAVGVRNSPDRISLYNGTAVIADGAFENCNKVTQIYLSSRMRIIGDYAFRGCTALESFEFGNSVSYIGESAFASCRKLSKIEIPDSVKEIGASAFEGCTALRQASTGNGVKVIESNTFDACTTLEQISIGAAVNHIKEMAFFGCKSLRDISLPAVIQHVSASAFLDCLALKYEIYKGGKYLSGEDSDYFLLYEVPDREITSLPLHPDTAVVAYGLFGSLEKLSTILIEENYGSGKNLRVANNCIYRLHDYNTVVMGMNHSRPYASSGELVIGDYAFYGCDLSAMERLGRSVAEIGDYAFAYSRGADSIRFFSEVRSIGEGAFMNCRSLQSIYFSGTKVERIGDRAFYGSALSGELSLPTGLKKLGASAFEGCTKLENVILSDTLIEVGNRAFADCTSLRGVQICPSTVSVGVDMMVNTSAGIYYTGDFESWLKVANRDAMKALAPYTVYCRNGKVSYN
jgi:hypothetical protein